MFSEMNSIAGSLRNLIQASPWQTELTRNRGFGCCLAASYLSLLDTISWTRRFANPFAFVRVGADSHDGNGAGSWAVNWFCSGLAWQLVSLSRSLSRAATALRDSQAAASFGEPEVAAQFADLTDRAILECEALAVPLRAGKIPLPEGRHIDVEERLEAADIQQIRSLVRADSAEAPLAALEDCARQLREVLVEHSVLLEVAHGDSITSFQVRYESGRGTWRYLDINGEDIYLIGYPCDTCAALFEIKGDAALPLAPDTLADLLRAGLPEVTTGITETISAILPKGDYLAGLMEIKPRLISPSRSSRNRPLHYHWSQYHTVIDVGHTVQEVMLPLVSRRRLDERRIEWYRDQIRCGTQPTALALSLVDARWVSGRQLEWRLVHFLLDGHHKVMAAGDLNQPLTILSFLSFTESFAVDRRYLAETVRLRYGKGSWL